MPTEEQTLTKDVQEWRTSRTVWFFSLVVLATLVFIKPLIVVMRGAFSEDQYSQMLVVPPLSAALIYLEQKSIFARISLTRLAASFFILFMLVFASLSFLNGGMDPSVYISLSILLFSGCCIGAFWF
ncbi:MAG TPA: hypothetical protein VLK33_15290, partial [Terriglobales bacterium]|nr:hypothetical protein [Terriglobales bacterium]